MKAFNKKGINSLIIGLDIVGFALIVVGGALIRYSKDEVLALIGGFVLAGGVTVLSITRLIGK